jgi:hypothetical protein
MEEKKEEKREEKKEEKREESKHLKDLKVRGDQERSQLEEDKKELRRQFESR